MPIRANIEVPSAIGEHMNQGGLQRRRIAFGIAAAVASIGLTRTVAAQNTVISYFRSGSFQFTILRPRQTVPSIRLFALDGKSIDLESLRGRPILLNFWASWCAACSLELPVLDRLQAQQRSSGLQIIAISEDRAGRAVVQGFVDKLQIRELKIYLDPNGYVAFDDAGNTKKAPFTLYGMPITYAIAASGWIVGYITGAADWTSPAAAKLIEYLKRS